jgi:hypothetical protein
MGGSSITSLKRLLTSKRTEEELAIWERRKSPLGPIEAFERSVQAEDVSFQ